MCLSCSRGPSMMMRKRKRHEVPEDRIVEEDPAPSSQAVHEVTEEGTKEELSGDEAPAQIPDGFVTMVSRVPAHVMHDSP